MYLPGRLVCQLHVLNHRQQLLYNKFGLHLCVNVCTLLQGGHISTIQWVNFVNCLHVCAGTSSWTFNRLIINLYKVQTHLAWFLNVCYHHHENKIYRYDEEYKDKKPSLSNSLCVFYAMDGLTYCLMYWQNSIQFGSTLSRNSSPSTPSEWTCLQTDCQYMEFSLVNLSWGMSTLQNKVKHIILNPVKFKITTTTPKICRLKIPIYKILFYKSTLICKILLFHYHNG